MKKFTPKDSRRQLPSLVAVKNHRVPGGSSIIKSIGTIAGRVQEKVYIPLALLKSLANRPDAKGCQWCTRRRRGFSLFLSPSLSPPTPYDKFVLWLDNFWPFPDFHNTHRGCSRIFAGREKPRNLFIQMLRIALGYLGRGNYSEGSHNSVTDFVFYFLSSYW